MIKAERYRPVLSISHPGLYFPAVRMRVFGCNLLGGLISFAALQLSRELGTGVRPMVPQSQLRDPARYLQEAVSEFASTGLLEGAVRVPGAVAPIKITADLRAGLIHCAATVPAPREGRPTTRVNWLVRQLKTAPGQLCIQPSIAFQRGRGETRTLDEARKDPRKLVEDPAHELRSFTVSLSCNAGPARGQGRGSFVDSVLTAVEKFYSEVAAEPVRTKTCIGDW
jgi:hypothetical protein